MPHIAKIAQRLKLRNQASYKKALQTRHHRMSDNVSRVAAVERASAVGPSEFMSRPLFPSVTNVLAGVCDPSVSTSPAAPPPPPLTAGTPSSSAVSTTRRRSLTVEDATTLFKQLESTVAPDLEGLPRTSQKCCGCGSTTLCVMRTVERTHWCAECVKQEPTMFQSVFDPALGYHRVQELVCFACNVAFQSYKSFLSHCDGKVHRGKCRRNDHFQTPGDVTWQMLRPSHVNALELQQKLVEKLIIGDERYRCGIPKEHINTLPLLAMFKEWEATERRISLTDPMHFAPLSSQSERQSLDLSSDETTFVAPEKSMPVVHVDASMSREEFDQMLHDLRTEHVYGFDTEAAPEHFFPDVRRVAPQVGPHLIQLCTRHRIYLISTTTKRMWQSICHLRTARFDKSRFSPKFESEALPAPKDVVTMSQATCDDNLSDAAREEAMNVLMGVPQGAATPRAQPQTASMAMDAPLPANFKTHDLVVPRFLFDFFHRDDIALVGFGLRQDVQLMRSLFRTSRWVAAPEQADPYANWYPPCVDICAAFRTDIRLTMQHRDDTKNANPAVMASITSQVQQRMVSSHCVGTVQAAARVFGCRFSKPRAVTMSNWACPSRYLNAKQLIYACRDAVLPLFMVERLLGTQALSPSASIGDADTRSKGVVEANPTNTTEQQRE